MESSESTKILIDSCRVFLKYAKREQVKGMLMLAGWSDTQCDKPMSSLLEHINTDFKIPRRRRQQKRRKRKKFRLAKHHLACASCFFVEFLCLRCTSTTRNFAISRYMEDGNTRQRCSLSFVKLDTVL